MTQTESYIKTISQGVVRNDEGALYYAPNLVKDQFAFDIAITHINNLIESGILTDANFKMILAANCRTMVNKTKKKKK